MISRKKKTFGISKSSFSMLRWSWACRFLQQIHRGCFYWSLAFIVCYQVIVYYHKLADTRLIVILTWSKLIVNFVSLVLCMASLIGRRQSTQIRSTNSNEFIDQPSTFDCVSFFHWLSKYTTALIPGESEPYLHHEKANFQRSWDVETQRNRDRAGKSRSGAGFSHPINLERFHLTSLEIAT